MLDACAHFYYKVTIKILIATNKAVMSFKVKEHLKSEMQNCIYSSVQTDFCKKFLIFLIITDLFIVKTKNVGVSDISILSKVIIHRKLQHRHSNFLFYLFVTYKQTLSVYLPTNTCTFICILFIHPSGQSCLCKLCGCFVYRFKLVNTSQNEFLSYIVCI